MINEIIVVGSVRRIAVTTPRDPRKGASAVVTVQWGPVREQSGGSVDFINAGLIRIPNYRFPKIQDKLKVGQRVKIIGHIQGVVKGGLDEPYITNELVADRVIILEDGPDVGTPSQENVSADAVDSESADE